MRALLCCGWAVTGVDVLRDCGRENKNYGENLSTHYVCLPLGGEKIHSFPRDLSCGDERLQPFSSVTSSQRGGFRLYFVFKLVLLLALADLPSVVCLSSSSVLTDHSF
jgi:hypothetical protein